MSLKAGIVSLMIGAMGAPAAEAACLRALRPVAEGEPATIADFAPSPCVEADSALIYDRSQRVARVRRAVTEGDVVRGSPAVLAAVRPRQALRLQTRIGPVTVERDVEVVRPARGGERVLVRGADGRVFAAPAPGAAP